MFALHAVANATDVVNATDGWVMHDHMVGGCAGRLCVACFKYGVRVGWG